MPRLSMFFKCIKFAGYSNFYSYKVVTKDLNVYIVRGVILSVFSLVFLRQKEIAVD